LKLKNKKIEALEAHTKVLNEKLEAIDPEFVAAAMQRLADEQAKIDALLVKKAAIIVAENEPDADKPVDDENSSEDSDMETVTNMDSNYEPI